MIMDTTQLKLAITDCQNERDRNLGTQINGYHSLFDYN